MANSSTTQNVRRERPTRFLQAAVVFACIGAISGCGQISAALPGQPSLLPDQVRALNLPNQYPPTAGQLPGSAPTLVNTGLDPRTIAVRVRNIGCGELSVGSGFALDPHTLVTNHHVVTGAKTLQVSTFDGRDLSVTAASSVQLADIAVVRTLEPLPQYPQLAAADPLPNSAITVVGYPLGGALTQTQGTILAPARDTDHNAFGQVLLSDVSVEAGSSGSPVLNDAGEVVGIVYAKTDDGSSAVIPVSTLRTLLNDASVFSPLAPCSGE